MEANQETLSRIIAQRPFAVLGYSAEDEVWCPRCLRSAAGLAPSGVDTEGRPVTPLYARDASVREEVCGNCDRPLAELLTAGRASRPVMPVTARFRVYGPRSALDFDRVPPLDVRTLLKSAGWRWDPRFRLWWSTAVSPEIPPQVVLVADARPAPAAPPFIRSSSEAAR